MITRNEPCVECGRPEFHKNHFAFVNNTPVSGGHAYEAPAPSPAQGTPEPPKVEELAGKLYGQLAYVDIGMEEWFKKAVALLRPYFPPASQTPPLENVLDVIGGLIARYETGDHADNPCGNCVICTAEKILEELATPASTARTDGWVSVEESLPQQEIKRFQDDVQVSNGLRIWTRPVNSMWKREVIPSDITHWRELPAAPGSVPQAPKEEKSK